MLKRTRIITWLRAIAKQTVFFRDCFTLRVRNDEFGHSSKLSIFTWLLVLQSINLASQSEFENYGPAGNETFKDLPSTLKAKQQGKKVYKLDLSYQEIKPELYDQVQTLSDLQALKLRGNNLSDYPKNFVKLYNLTYFASFANPLTAFPPELKPFANLYFLEFQQSKIDSVPARIAYLDKLQTLKFGNTSDTVKLPTTLKYLRNLKNVSFTNCVLDSLPSALFQLPGLVNLTLSNTNTYYLNGGIGNLKNLEVLVIENNNLSKIPFDIYKAKKLKAMSFRKNKLTTLPESIAQLENLAVLDIRDNFFTREEIEKLKALLPACDIRF